MKIFNFTEKELQKGTFYHFQILLDTPYKWGDGYGSASSNDISENNKAFEEIFNFLNQEKTWKIVEAQHSFECPSWYNTENEIEEIYSHPMELSGTLEYDKIIALAEFIENSNFKRTKLEDLRFHEVVESYSYKEAYDIFTNNLEKALVELKKEHSYGVPSNYKFKEFGLNFKPYGFVKNYFNKTQDEIKKFFISVINEKLSAM